MQAVFHQLTKTVVCAKTDESNDNNNSTIIIIIDIDLLF
jgi:hypothetical protein